jgi:hypothetical protein
LARPFESGGDSAAHSLARGRRGANGEDGDVRRHADLEPHRCLKSVKRGSARAPDDNRAAAASGEPKRSEEHGGQGAHRRSRVSGKADRHLMTHGRPGPASRRRNQSRKRVSRSLSAPCLPPPSALR